MRRRRRRQLPPPINASIPFQSLTLLIACSPFTESGRQEHSHAAVFARRYLARPPVRPSTRSIQRSSRRFELKPRERAQRTSGQFCQKRRGKWWRRQRRTIEETEAPLRVKAVAQERTSTARLSPRLMERFSSSGWRSAASRRTKKENVFEGHREGPGSVKAFPDASYGSTNARANPSSTFRKLSGITLLLSWG